MKSHFILKPKIKASHPVIIGDKAICIGEIPGYANIIKNPAPWVVELLDLLDGTRTLEQLFILLKDKGFSIQLSDVARFLQKLEEYSFLEEGNVISEHLSKEELERYHRQMLYFSLVEKNCDVGFFYQEKLKKQNVAILGVGGWGSWIALNLTAAGIGKLTLIDGDIIERSNLNRQILFETSDIGKSKVEVAGEKLKKINPNVVVDKIQKKLTSNKKEIEEIIKECTFIVLAWTNLLYFKENTIEEATHTIAFENNIPIIEIGADPLFVSVGPILPNKVNKKRVCFECVKKSVLKKHYSLNPLTRSFQDKRLQENRKNLNKLLFSYQAAPALSVMGGLASDQMIKYITQCEPTSLVHMQFKFSLQNYQITQQEFFPSTDCLKCNELESIDL